MATSRVIVTVDDEHLADLDELAARLREHGMEVDQVLASGFVIGTVEDLEALRDVPGILTVDEEGVMGVPPPDQEIQ